MKAIYAEQYGGPENLIYGDRPDPKFNQDSMVLKVLAASINPVDYKILQGYMDARLPVIFPLITGWDVCGEIVELGPAVYDYEVGQRVVAYARKDFVGHGTWAEYVSVPERGVAPAPESVDAVHASALPLAGLTAFQALTGKLEVGPGQQVVINGAAGGVGSYAVQIARALGAEVIGTGSEGSYNRIRELGATPAPYGEHFAEAVREIAPDGVHAVFDLYGGEGLDDAKRVLNSRGRVATIGLPADAKQHGAMYVFVKPNGPQLRELVAMVDDNKLRIDVADTFALRDAADAVRRAEQKHTHGKLVLAP
ncbi:MAG: NADP-dependent oxidoreductase [Solirubrobacterales bacterium]